jgi:hypothetical protein
MRFMKRMIILRFKKIILEGWLRTVIVKKNGWALAQLFFVYVIKAGQRLLMNLYLPIGITSAVISPAVRKCLPALLVVPVFPAVYYHQTVLIFPGGAAPYLKFRPYGPGGYSIYTDTFWSQLFSQGFYIIHCSRFCLRIVIEVR